MMMSCLFVVQLLSHVFDLHVMDLLFYYIDLQKNKDVRLAFEALKVNSVSMFYHSFTVLLTIEQGATTTTILHNNRLA